VTLTVNLPEDLAHLLEAAAAARGVSAEQVVVEALTEAFTTTGEHPRRRLAFAGIGASGSARGAAHTEELLAEGFGRD
jgi:plasmid stability protein